MEKIYNKLVRDNIPEIIKSNGGEPIYRKLNDDEYWKYLLLKDKEELQEVEEAENLEERKKELADKLEVLKAMAEFSGFSLSEIMEEASEKRDERGGFDKRVFLEKVIEE